MTWRHGMCVGCMAAALLIFVGVSRAAEEGETEGQSEAEAAIELAQPPAEGEGAGQAEGEGEEGEEEEVKVQLPQAAADAIAAAFPKATIEAVGIERKDGLTLYEVKLKQEQTEETRVTVAADGTITDVTAEIAAEYLPEAVADAVRAAAPEAEFGRIERIETRAEIQLVVLAKPSTGYKVKLEKDDLPGEMTIAPDGKVVVPLVWQEKEKGDAEGADTEGAEEAPAGAEGQGADESGGEGDYEEVEEGFPQAIGGE